MDSDAPMMLVEDNPCISQSICQMLKTCASPEMICFENGEDALGEILRQAPALLIVNFRLAGKMNGLELIYRVRVRYFFPIILLTGVPYAEIPPAFGELPDCSFLPKPFSPFQLQKLVDLALK